MAVLASVIIAEAQVLLNDSGGLFYTSPVMIPIVQKAYRELQTKLAKYGVSSVKEVSATITVAAGTVALVSGGQLPADLLYPISLQEKAQGASADQYVGMREEEWEETDLPTVELRVWTWREEEIKFLGATTNRDIRIDYRKGLTPVTATTTPIALLDAETFLASRAAAIAAAVIGENYDRAQALNADASLAWEDLIAIQVKRKQAIPVRRRRTRYRA